MEPDTDIIIIGGGIIGLACAHYLVKRNVSVKIIEQSDIGSGASHGNCGILFFSGIIPLCAPGVVKHEILRTILRNSPLYIKPTLNKDLIMWLLKFAAHCNSSHMNTASKVKNEISQYSLNLYNKLFSENTLNCNFEKKGMIMVFKNKKSFKKYKSTNNFLRNYNLDGISLDIDQAQKLEPAIKNKVKGAYYNKNDWHLRPEMLLDSWKNLLVEKGVIIKKNCRMIDFRITKGKVTHVNTSRGQYKADKFILTTGAFAQKVNKQLKLNIPVQPGKGYSITMESPDQSLKLPCYLYETNVVATPWKTGCRLGGTMEFSGFNNSLNKKRLSKLITGAKEYLHSTGDTPVIEEWSGLRPMTYDDLPIIDRFSLHDNLFLATGHGMLGLTLATGTGKAICDMVFGEKPEIDLTPFSINRF